MRLLLRNAAPCGAIPLVLWLLTAATLIGARQCAVADDPTLARVAEEVECRRAAGPIRIDGGADEPAWRTAVVVDRFSANWSKSPAKSATAARLLWDDQYLYFFADMQDPDLYADMTEHDDMTWLNDVFELFFKPAESHRGYYEFQINAANTQMDMYLPSRGSGGYRRWARARQFGWQTAVKRQGDLNSSDDDATNDQGWSVEGRFPWTDFAPSGGKPPAGARWRFALCRYDYSKALEAPDLTSSAKLTLPDFHRYEDYSILRFVGGP